MMVVDLSLPHGQLDITYGPRLSNQVALLHASPVPLSCQVSTPDIIDLQEPMKTDVTLVEISRNPIRLVFIG